MSDAMRDPGSLPPDLRAIDGGLQRLAEAERAGAPGALTERLFAATRATIAGAAPRPRVVVHERRERAARSLRLLTPMRLAALLALAGAAAAVRLAGVAVPVGGASASLASLDTEVDSMLGASDALDEDLADLGQHIDLIFADMVSIGEAVGEDEAWIDGGAL